MNVEDLKKHYGAKNDAQLAKILGRPRSTIHYWNGNGIPTSTQAIIQLQTKGKLKADIQALIA